MPYAGLVERHIHARPDSFERKIWSFPDGTTELDGRMALLFLDAELYLERVEAAAVLRRLWERRAIPRVPTFFLSHGGAEARHRDFVCSADYADFLANDVADSIRRDGHPDVSEFVLVGLSLSGLAAAHAATRFPHRFPAAVCQSPSFWWERVRFADELPPAPRPGGQEFWVSVGNRETETGVTHSPSAMLQEISQIAGCTAAVEALRGGGYHVSYREYEGGHDPACWREDLALALPWIWRDRLRLPPEPAMM